MPGSRPEAPESPIERRGGQRDPFQDVPATELRGYQGYIQRQFTVKRTLRYQDLTPQQFVTLSSCSQC
jgi:hypothetical protein